MLLVIYPGVSAVALMLVIYPAVSAVALMLVIYPGVSTSTLLMLVIYLGVSAVTRLMVLMRAFYLQQLPHAQEDCRMLSCIFGFCHRSW